jgi:hypothetical protein
MEAQLEFIQNGNVIGYLPFIVDGHFISEPIYIVQGWQFRVVAQWVKYENGLRVVTDINPDTCIGELTFGDFPVDKVVKWTEAGKGHMYHLDAQFPDNVYCATGKICRCDVWFQFIPACFDQVPSDKLPKPK